MGIFILISAFDECIKYRRTGKRNIPNSAIRSQTKSQPIEAVKNKNKLVRDEFIYWAVIIKVMIKNNMPDVGYEPSINVGMKNCLGIELAIIADARDTHTDKCKYFRLK